MKLAVDVRANTKVRKFMTYKLPGKQKLKMTPE